jgi:hypothetical protein
MHAVVDPLVASEPKLGKVDAKNFISDRFLKKLEDEGFVQTLMGRWRRKLSVFAQLSC